MRARRKPIVRRAAARRSPAARVFVRGLRPPPRRPSWKLLGLAGAAGVAATGVAVARKRRPQRAVDADELRARLHERLAAIPPEPGA